jgi:hypothetical protein
MSSVRAPLIVAAAIAIAACSGVGPQSQTSAAPPAANPAPAAPPQSTPAATVAGDMRSDLPPLPVTPFPAARPMEIVRSVFTFAADHPEVLSKVPCFCGCENRGHKNNDDCFVAARDAGGRVTAWEPHGVG